MSLKKNKKKKGRKSFDIGRKLTKAIQSHQSGQLQKAEEIYKNILEINPNHSDALHLLGLVAYQVGKNDIAVDLINKAIQNNPKIPSYYNNIGLALQEQGKLSEAISSYEKALQLKPDYVNAHINMGNVFEEQGKPDQAISSYEKALQLKPDYAEVYNNMGNVLEGQGKSEEAIACYEKALQIEPDYAEAYNNMGIAFQGQGDRNEALACYEKALQLKPNYVEAYYNMGNVLKDLHKSNEAISCFEKALQLKPNYAEAYNNMGNVFRSQRKSNEAIACFQRALEIKPDYAEVYNNMGNAFQDKGELKRTVLCYEKALEVNPDYVEAYNNMGNVFQNLRMPEEAIACYEKALLIKPDLPATYNHLFHQLQHMCDWQKLKGMTNNLDGLTAKAIDNGTRSPEMPFVNLTRHADPPLNLAVARSWSSDIARRMSSLKNAFSFDDRSSNNKKITIGYISNDFGNHPVAHLMLGLFGLHNRDEFEIVCYSYGKDDGSSTRQRIKRDCDHFVDLRKRSEADAANCIYEGQVDILVDLMGWTRGNRLGISALRPAPVQVSYLGFLGTTGAECFDYIITDRIVTPEDQASFYSENFVYMPHCYQVNDNTQVISNKKFNRADFGLPEDAFVFCSFNNPYKIEPVMFDSWMKILKQVPVGVLWLQRPNERVENNLRQEAEARRVNSERLVFSEKLPLDEHLRRLKIADIALDTRIYNGGATTSNALWAGVPVITLQGNHFVSRMSSSSLAAIGLPELITYSLEEYQTLAVRMACNSDELQRMRQKLNENRLTESFFDTPRFVRNLEKAYKEMWEIFLAKARPRQIKVVED
jgi:protein O-GlcNAc transferase